MSSTKIINILKDDNFEELLDIVKNTDASEVIFITPKKTKAFKSEGHFAVLSDEAKDSGKLISFMSSSPDVVKFAEKYSFDVLSLKPEKPTARTASISTKQDGEKQTATTVATNDEDQEDGESEEEDFFNDTQDKPEEIIENKEETEYKEEEQEPETSKEDPPFGTELDESGNPVYEEDEKEEDSFLDNDQEGLITPAKMESRAKKEVDIKSVWKEDPTDNIWGDISPKTKKHPNFNVKTYPSAQKIKQPAYKSKRVISVLSVASVLILASVVYLTTGSAKVEITPMAEKIDFQIKVSSSPDFSSVNNSFKRIPGQLFAISESAVDEFNATAEKNAVQKSRGTITVYNKYSTSPQPLVVSTRFEFTKDGKETGMIFRTLQTITVPGMKVENDEITPGKIAVEVIADKAGQDYNVSAGDFGIVAWRENGDSARYEKMYGESESSMRGGIIGKAKVVSESDYESAKDHLTARVINDINTSLEKQSVGLEILDDVMPSIDSIESTAGVDDATDKFTMAVNGSLRVVGFKKEDLMAVISEHIDRTKGLMIIPEKIELSYEDVALNDNNELEMTVRIRGNAYAKIDKDSIVSDLLGKNEAQIKNHLGSIKEINSAKIILSPFWVKKIPGDDKKVNVLLTY